MKGQGPLAPLPLEKGGRAWHAIVSTKGALGLLEKEKEKEKETGGSSSSRSKNNSGSLSSVFSTPLSAFSVGRGGRGGMVGRAVDEQEEIIKTQALDWGTLVGQFQSVAHKGGSRRRLSWDP